MPKGQVQIPGQVMGGDAVVASSGMEGGEMETLKKHLPFSGEEELKEIAVRFEEKIFTVATSQQHYLRKISLKMLTMDSKSQNPTANSLQPNAASDNGTNPQDPECE
ncbi:Mediator of RNA polymerase II transcription subunit 15a [Castilleja foliolosa]|uniref:Mediator of RNA polymerase II transcription subunit 15a n=1 Tax=Castilleja foliolosa TaxID=1961234 RepID=A0ABD3BZE0_9LAMI